jgi:cytochrome oxidase Cu insertion factor (SCO1/SenC/PrrC family)
MAKAKAKAKPKAKHPGRSKMLLIAALCAAPVIASYVAFYVWQPKGRVNYGDLLEVRQLPPANLALPDGKPFHMTDLKGKWVMVSIDSGDCAEACEAKLFMMRQLRLMQGADMDRIARVFLITDDKPLTTLLLREYDGTRMIRAQGSPALDAFPATDGRNTHIYLIDPYGNLMMRFPQNPDPERMKKDIQRLLKAQGSAE